MLKVRGVSKKYSGENLGAVNNVSFNLANGEVLSIIGESGSGKTTLLRILAGLMKPDSGSLSLNGEPFLNPEGQLIAGQPSVKMVFQDYNLKPNMTVRENVAYQLLGLEGAEQAKRVDELLKICGLSDLSQRRPNQLSGGQQQRLSLARALAGEPEVLLMDEPFSNLDPVNKQRLLLEIQNIVGTLEIALVFVSHDRRDAMLISDRIGFMAMGGLVQLDKPEKLYYQPQNLDVARFMGFTNELNRNQLALLLLPLPEGCKVGVIRAEDIGIERPGHSGKVIKQGFLEGKYLLKIRVDKQLELLAYSSRGHFQLGQTIGFAIDPDKVIYF